MHCSLSKWAQQPELGQGKPESRSFFQVCHMSAGSQTLGLSSAAFAGRRSRREPCWKWSSLKSNHLALHVLAHYTVFLPCVNFGRHHCTQERKFQRQSWKTTHLSQKVSTKPVFSGAGDAAPALLPILLVTFNQAVVSNTSLLGRGRRKAFGTS